LERCSDLGSEISSFVVLSFKHLIIHKFSASVYHNSKGLLEHAIYTQELRILPDFTITFTAEIFGRMVLFLLPNVEAPSLILACCSFILTVFVVLFSLSRHA
jgi:hypothetical protein